MPEKAAKEVGADPVMASAVNDVMEAWFEYLGPRKATAYLRILATRVTTPPEADGVIALQNRAHALDIASGRLWLQRRLPHWLSKYG